MNKTIFITGASSGLGKATAKFFAAKGWNVIATMLAPENETELNHIPNVRLLKLDVTKDHEVADAVKASTTGGSSVDVVFNNAGYGLAGPVEASTIEQVQDVMDVNFVGYIRVIKAFTPYFRERGNGLFINTSSIAAYVGVPLNSMYAASKWAIEGWTESVSYELNKVGITIKTVNPGWMTGTEFFSDSHMVKAAPHRAYQQDVDKMHAAFKSPEYLAHASTTEKIAESVYEAATDGKNQLRYFAGDDAKELFALRQQLGQQAYVEEQRRKG
ncbi:MAG TPA: SDR family oxidoreductase [Dyella sp.]|uniref:SDR family oxidoreductase n=1 Tax=Dyella sp. TaxID=1869338 RepID=UPI002C190485|nr:SDR family oxidoreductase [Dyella sp.]HTV84831.1 SDR family oxidoreductase [Dyella sp.]